MDNAQRSSIGPKVDWSLRGEMSNVGKSTKKEASDTKNILTGRKALNAKIMEQVGFASKNAKFGQPEVKLGLIPGWGGTQRLPRIIGKGNATELIIGGHIIDSNEALRIGLVNKVFKQESLLNETISFAKIVLSNGPNSISESLRCINISSNHSLNEGLNEEVDSFSNLFESDETKEGLKAFVEKRKPKFRS